MSHRTSVDTRLKVKMMGGGGTVSVGEERNTRSRLNETNRRTSVHSESGGGQPLRLSIEGGFPTESIATGSERNGRKLNKV